MQKIKAFLKQFPISYRVNRLIYNLFFRKKIKPYVYKHVNPPADADNETVSMQKILNILNYMKTSENGFASQDFPAGYQEIEINGKVFTGTRKPKQRLEKVPFDFTGKTVLDIGCNHGGMIWALRDKVRWAVGVDINYKFINAAHVIRAEMQLNHTNFFVFDADRNPHELLKNYIPEEKVDIVFLLSVCSFIKKWPELINFCMSISDTMLFEAHGYPDEQQVQIDYLKKSFKYVKLLSETSDDDERKKNRQLFIATNLEQQF